MTRSSAKHRLHEREEANADLAQASLATVVDRLTTAEAKLDETLSRLTPSTPPSTPATAKTPDLGALLRDMMGDEEPVTLLEDPEERRWRDVLLAGAGGMLVGGVAVAAATWR